MILIADSGSTKCTWALCSKTERKVQYFATIGFNPFFVDAKQINSHLEQSNLKRFVKDITEVHFYGAGCSNDEMNKVIEIGLSNFFQNAKISVAHDLNAACLATFQGKDSICCILGTGSNSCFYDGKNIVEAAPSLGFIVGDEASGNYFGKKILQLYFNKKLSDKLAHKLEKEYALTLQNYNENVYYKNCPNRYLATFFKFLAENKSETTFQNIIQNGLREFFELHICCFENYQNYPINFIGSVAYFLQEELNVMAKEYGCKIGQIIQNPIENLVKSHQVETA